jgi:hypothetical protein
MAAENDCTIKASIEQARKASFTSEVQNPVDVNAPFDYLVGTVGREVVPQRSACILY